MSDHHADAYIYGICAERRKPGGCQLHNLHCRYPDCDRVLPNHGGHDPISTAREEGFRAGRLAGIEEAAKLFEPYAAAIRALKEKQP